MKLKAHRRRNGPQKDAPFNSPVAEMPTEDDTQRATVVKEALVGAEAAIAVGAVSAVTLPKNAGV